MKSFSILTRLPSFLCALLLVGLNGCILTERKLIREKGSRFSLDNSELEVQGLRHLYKGERKNSYMVALEFLSRNQDKKIALKNFEITISFAGRPATIDEYRAFGPYITSFRRPHRGSFTGSGPCPCNFKSDNNKLTLYFYFNLPTAPSSGDEIEINLKTTEIISGKPPHVFHTNQKRRLEIKRRLVISCINPAAIE